VSDTSFERVFLALASLLTLGAYLDAWARVQQPVALSPWEEVAATAAWLAVTALLVLTLARNLGRRVPWQRSLPDGYHLSLAGCLVFGAAAVVDVYWTLAFGYGTGLQALTSPLHLLEVVAGGLIVSGPLRAAMRGPREVAGVLAVVSAALTMCAVTFLTQFANPLIDVWSARGGHAPQVVWWVAESTGLTAILLQATVLLSFMLLLLRRFTLPFGSLTLLSALNGAVVVLVMMNLPLLPAMVATGIAADLLVLVLKPSEAQERARRLSIFSAAVPAAYVVSYGVSVAIAYGTWWPAGIWVGAALIAAVLGFLLAQLVEVRKPRPRVEPAGRLPPHHEVEVNPQDVKQALEMLRDTRALAVSPMTRLACISGEGAAAGQELHDLLVDVVRELAASKLPRDAEAGQLLAEYYVRRSGSHEVIAERLHLSRPTFYRRLQRGLGLVAERIDELSEFAARHSAP
jgi:hypothetical protein